MQSATRHQCFIYEGPPSLQLPALAATIQKRLKENFRCLYLNSPEMVSAMQACLQNLKVNVADEIAKNRLSMMSATAVSTDGRFDVEAMINGLEEAVAQALIAGFKGLFATGDMTWELGNQKESFARLIDYEWRLERLFHKQPALCGICQYHRDTLSPELMRAGFLAHKSIFINETLSRINSYYAESMSEAEQQVSKNAKELDEAVSKLSVPQCELNA